MSDQPPQFAPASSNTVGIQVLVHRGGVTLNFNRPAHYLKMDVTTMRRLASRLLEACDEAERGGEESPIIIPGSAGGPIKSGVKPHYKTK